MGARRVGRERALQALYQLEQDPRVQSPAALEAAWTAHDDEGPKDPAADACTKEIHEGIKGHPADIDALIEQHSHN